MAGLGWAGLRERQTDREFSLGACVCVEREREHKRVERLAELGEQHFKFWWVWSSVSRQPCQ